MPVHFIHRNMLHCDAANAWPALQRATLLICLQGPALQFVLSLNNLASVNVAQLAGQLTGHFAPASNIALHCVAFRSRCCCPGEPLASFRAEISKLGCAAYSALPCAVQTELARDQLIDGLDTRDLCFWVHEGDPGPLYNAIARALHLEEIYMADRL